MLINVNISLNDGNAWCLINCLDPELTRLSHNWGVLYKSSFLDDLILYLQCFIDDE